MDEPDDHRAPGRGKGCGCQTAFLFMLTVGLPVLFLFSFGLSPCRHGPCNPNGKRDLLVTAAVLLALSALVGLGAWRFADWWARRQAARDRDGLRQLRLAFAAFFLLVAAGFIVLALR